MTMNYVAYIMLYNGMEEQEILQELKARFPVATEAARQEAIRLAQEEIRLNANEYPMGA